MLEGVIYEKKKKKKAMYCMLC